MLSKAVNENEMVKRTSSFRSIELICREMDSVLREAQIEKNKHEKDYEQVIAKIDELIEISTLLDERDAFFSVYSKLLAKRILLHLSSFEIERKVVQSFKVCRAIFFCYCDYFVLFCLIT